MATPTIYALSTGTGRSGIAVIRISGPETKAVLQALAGGVPQPRMAHLATFRARCGDQDLDRGLALFFPAPDSFTGEDVAELHIHGSPAVTRRMLEELAQVPGTALAEPGEFTERAFNNGKMDLTEVEGLSDLIAADTELQRQQALAQTSGVLRDRSEGWRKTLIHALALIEAVLDFSDEPDVTDGPVQDACSSVRDLAAELKSALSDTARADTIRNGLQVAIIGPPNVGKSSLMNTLAARDVAIVTAQPGTTRDTIEVQLELAGLPVTLVDTAGLRESSDVIESEGVRRAHIQARNADLVLYVSEATGNPEPAGTVPREFLQIVNKIDLTPDQIPRPGTICISVKTGAGVDQLLERLTGYCQHAASGHEPPLVTRERQRLCLERCLVSLDQFETGDMSQLELRAENLRMAANSLGRLTGEIDVEDVLDDIFSGFCIGK